MIHEPCRRPQQAHQEKTDERPNQITQVTGGLERGGQSFVGSHQGNWLLQNIHHGCQLQLKGVLVAAEVCSSILTVGGGGGGGGEVTSPGGGRRG